MKCCCNIALFLFLYCHIELHLYVLQIQESSAIIVVFYNLMSSKDVEKKGKIDLYSFFMLDFINIRFLVLIFFFLWTPIYYTVSYPFSNIALFLLPCFVMLLTKYLYIAISSTIPHYIVLYKCF